MGSSDKISEEGRDKAVPEMTGWIEMATFDAVVFAVANLVCGSVGARNGDSMYRRITTVTLQDSAGSVPPEDDIVCKADSLSPVFLSLKDGTRISFRIWE